VKLWVKQSLANLQTSFLKTLKDMNMHFDVRCSMCLFHLCQKLQRRYVMQTSRTKL